MMDCQQGLRPRLQFSSSEEWRSYVERNVPAGDRPYVLASGLTSLYVTFYGMRSISVPEGMQVLLEEAHTLPEPARTAKVNAVNEQLFAGMSRFLFAQPSGVSGSRPTPQAEIAISGLFDQLERQNEPFALWCNYQRARSRGSKLPDWQQYIRALLSDDETSVMEFVLSMSTLGELMQQLREQKKRLPTLLADRICVLHREREGRERNLATRVILQELLEILNPCTSA